MSSSQQASEFFAHYLDGKAAPSKSPKDPSNRKGKGKGKAPADSSDESERIMKLFDQRDKDKDGRVTLEEFLAGRTSETVPILTRRFKQLDRDSDGFWSKSELESASKLKEAGK